MKLHYTYCVNTSYGILEFTADNYPASFYENRGIVISHSWSIDGWKETFCTPRLKVANTYRKHSSITP